MNDKLEVVIKFPQYVKGDLKSNREGVVFLTVHDIGSNHKTLVRFTADVSMEEVAQRVAFIHVCIPGQDKNAGDFGSDFPSMQVRYILFPSFATNPFRI